ncbi:MAG: alpha/beta fold hydrolase [Verrucomicrobiales bacterium]|nr:alpha/beta fold hydrolase [Verrucomicrobiales bacterium]
MSAFSDEFDTALSASEAEMLPASAGWSQRVRWWWPATAPLAGVLMLHGMQSNGRWFSRSAAALARRGIVAVALDRPSSGESSGPTPPSPPPGTGLAAHLPDPESFLSGITEVHTQLRQRLGRDIPLTLMANCFGARAAIIELGRHPDRWQRALFTAPGTDMHPRTRPPWRDIARILLPLPGISPWLRVPLQDTWFTDQPDALAWIQNDVASASLRWITTATLRATRRLDRAWKTHLPRISTPLHLLLAERDVMTRNDRIEKRFRRDGQSPLKISRLPSEHMLEFGSAHPLALDLMAEWIHASEPG